ncbi:peptide deformylase [Cellulosimicrobium cellulans]|uniref:peptide deformylase n=1 Tax=Cellulosimicrobium cellulans TaxID=1710 RepID=UPI0024052352|nr:peptide deformylase [Cellulosimicrobium cellulans]MDF9875013.1 peptide deformylase [Cellulosimicrobium cellulans]
MSVTGRGAGVRQGVDEALREHVVALLDAYDDGVLPIVQAGQPVLRTPAVPYAGQLGDVLPRFLEAMRATMHAAPGVGLAAPQVGIGLAVAVVEDPGTPDADDERERPPLAFRVLVNPRYEAVGDETRTFFEGCLSVHGWQAERTRARSVRLTGQDEAGEPFDDVLTGWAARIVQHETDHLRGELYVDGADLRTLSSTLGVARLPGASREAG